MSMSRGRRALLIVTFVAAIIGVGLLIAQDQVVMHVTSAVAADDPGHPDYIADLVGAALWQGNAFEVLTNGPEIFPAMLGAIDAAQRRISFETYIYGAGHIADRFTDAFERAARRGVTVNLVVDGVGASGMERKHIERLEAAGVRLATFNPPHWHRLEDVNYRTHRKILVVDGETAFTGGASVADHWVDDGESGGGWRDTQVRIRGPIVRGMEAAFYESFLQAGGPGPPHLDPRPAPAGDDSPALLVRSSSTGGANELKQLYLLTLASARHSIDIASPYFITDRSTFWSLEDAVRRGVRVRVLMESHRTDALPVKFASRADYERLMATGVELYEYQPTLMHAKILVVDRIWSMFGSANFDNRSLELNEELNVAVSSRSLAERFLADFERDLAHAERITPETWRQRPLVDRVRERFWFLFGEVF